MLTQLSTVEDPLAVISLLPIRPNAKNQNQPMTFKARIAWFILILVLLLPFANIGSDVVVATFLGGTAANCKIVDGRYFFFSHGKYTEVSHEIYEYSKIHGYAVVGMIALFFLALAGIGCLKLLTIFLTWKNRYRRLE